MRCQTSKRKRMAKDMDEERKRWQRAVELLRIQCEISYLAIVLYTDKQRMPKLYVKFVA